MFKSLNRFLYKTPSLNHRLPALPAHPRPPWTSPPGYPDSLMKHKKVRSVPLLLLPSLKRRGQGGDPRQTPKAASKGPEISQERKAHRGCLTLLWRGRWKPKSADLEGNFFLLIFWTKIISTSKIFFPQCFLFPYFLNAFWLQALCQFFTVDVSSHVSSQEPTSPPPSPYLFPEISIELMVSHPSRFSDFPYNVFDSTSFTLMK